MMGLQGYVCAQIRARRAALARGAPSPMMGLQGRFWISGWQTTFTLSGGGGHGSGSSRAPRHILPLVRRRLSVAMPRRNTPASPQRARIPFQRLGVLHPAAEGERQQRRDRQNQPVALHPRGVGPPSFPPPPAHAFQRIEARFYPEAHLAPRRPGLRRREVGQDNPRLVLTIVPDDDYRPPKAF